MYLRTYVTPLRAVGLPDRRARRKGVTFEPPPQPESGHRQRAGKLGL